MAYYLDSSMEQLPSSLPFLPRPKCPSVTECSYSFFPRLEGELIFACSRAPVFLPPLAGSPVNPLVCDGAYVFLPPSAGSPVGPLACPKVPVFLSPLAGSPLCLLAYTLRGYTVEGNQMIRFK